MKAVFRHELSSYFTGMAGYVFGAFLLLFAGIYTMVINLNAGQATFEYVLSNMSFVFLVAIPILTMRVLAEERKQKTDQLLYALPLTMTQVILGKYLAMLVLFLVPVAVICVYPILLSGFGNLYLPAAFGAIGGFFLLGMALLAVGMFISSVTESQPVAAGLCFAVLLVNYFLSSLSGYLSSTAFGSFLCLTVVILVLALIVWRMTRNGLAAFLTAAVLEVGMTVWFVLVGPVHSRPAFPVRALLHLCGRRF